MGFATTKLYGRLGNNMFQLAAAYGYALKHGKHFYAPRHACLKYFPNIKTTAGRLDPSTFKYAEPKHSYVEIPKHLNIEIDGYFQSELYFKDYRQQIIELFDLPKASINKVGLHIRRGDYLQYPTKHPVVTTDYIQKAMRYFVAMGVKDFFVFSDDIEWCKGNISFPETTIEFSEGKNEFDDMVLMSQCHHQIISNSTFSWWAAWLNQNPDKVVISPHEDNWFGVDNKQHDVSDVIPKEWIRIKYGNTHSVLPS